MALAVQHLHALQIERQEFSCRLPRMATHTSDWHNARTPQLEWATSVPSSPQTDLWTTSHMPLKYGRKPFGNIVCSL